MDIFVYIYTSMFSLPYVQNLLQHTLRIYSLMMIPFDEVLLSLHLHIMAVRTSVTRSSPVRFLYLVRFHIC